MFYINLKITVICLIIILHGILSIPVREKNTPLNQREQNDLDTANSFGYGYYGGYPFYRGYGYGFGYPYYGYGYGFGYPFYGGYGGYGGYGYGYYF